MLEDLAFRDDRRRHVGMVVEDDVIAVEQTRQFFSFERRRIHRDRRVARAVNAVPDRLKLMIAVDEDGFHGDPTVRLRKQ